MKFIQHLLFGLLFYLRSRHGAKTHSLLSANWWIGMGNNSTLSLTQSSTANSRTWIVILGLIETILFFLRNIFLFSQKTVQKSESSVHSMGPKVRPDGWNLSKVYLPPLLHSRTSPVHSMFRNSPHQQFFLPNGTPLNRKSCGIILNTANPKDSFISWIKNDIVVSVR